GEDDSLNGEDAGLGDAAAIGLAERGDGEPWAAATPVRPVDEPGQVEPVPGRVGEGGVGEDLSSIGDVVAPADDAEVPFGGDFARQLRRKMSAMAERLFRADASGPVPALPVAPRHDHHTEIDLAALVDDGPALGAVTEIVQRERATSQITRDEAPVTGDTQLRGRADSGELVRGQADAAALMARAFASAHTGALELRRGEVEKLVYFDRGRPVFAASNQSHDRMGQLLFREGKITAEQYQRCQSLVAASGRRMGEILVDLGYLKRRELLPAVRRHVEDLVYSVFAWSSGTFRFVAGDGGAGERIRLSRHPSAMILEGIRRKLTEPDLVALVGGPTTVLEIGSAERLAAMVATADLSLEEQAALAAIDGRRDVAAVTRAAAVEPQVVLQLAYGLIVLGVLTARRTADDPDDAPVLVGETDLAIDRERVHARWALVVDADYFALLGVRRDATTFEIRRAYEAARRDFSPDSFPPVLRRELAAELGEIGHVLDEAHRVLRDPGLRASYLRHLVLD
ncbi:MAG: DUF4388 domain-containing protein, partial [Kofleriaceae bacterium]|nr:DUF4388 domain-containing protein [Kofleriaceae bacterium]